MKIELISVIGLLLCLLIIGIEYILHYRLAELQDEYTARVDHIRRRLDNHVEGVLFAPTVSSRNAEIKALSEEINGDFEVYEMALTSIREHKGSRYSTDAEALDNLIAQINEQVVPVEIYAKMLEEGDVYHKSYACRRLAELEAMEYHDKIKEYVDSKERELAYNAAMALCHLGDVFEVARYLLSIQDDHLYSARIINEFFAQFTGDRQELAGLLFESCNPYMKCTIIKTIAPYKIDAFRPMGFKPCLQLFNVVTNLNVQLDVLGEASGSEITGAYQGISVRHIHRLNKLLPILISEISNVRLSMEFILIVNTALDLSTLHSRQNCRYSNQKLILLLFPIHAVIKTGEHSTDYFLNYVPGPAGDLISKDYAYLVELLPISVESKQTAYFPIAGRNIHLFGDRAPI